MQVELMRVLLTLAHELRMVLADQVPVHVRRHARLEAALCARE